MLGGSRNPYGESLESKSNSPDPLVRVKQGSKIADFDILPFISFIIALRALECIKRYWETICKDSRSYLPPDPL